MKYRSQISPDQKRDLRKILAWQSLVYARCKKRPLKEIREMK